MKRTHITLMGLAFVVALWSGCGTDPGNGVESFLVDINNQWTVQGQADHTFSFICDTTDPLHEASACAFRGSEDLNGSSATLTGTYSGRQIQFTVQRDGGVRFDGTFSDKNTMSLRGEGQTLTVTRG